MSLRIPFFWKSASAETIKSQNFSDLPNRSDTQMEVDWRETLGLWLRWDEAHRQILSKMCESQENPSQYEDVLDQLEQLRREAVRQSKKLLHIPRC